MGNSNNPPMGIKIISGLTILLAVLICLFGLGAIIGYFIEGSFLHSFYGFDEFPDAKFGYVLLFASVLIGFASLVFYAGYGLLKGNNTAKKILIIFIAMELLGALQGLMIEKIRGFAFLLIVIFGPILLYIIYSEEVKEFFN